jgi:hypothetical protein
LLPHDPPESNALGSRTRPPPASLRKLETRAFHFYTLSAFVCSFLWGINIEAQETYYHDKELFVRPNEKSGLKKLRRDGLADLLLGLRQRAPRISCLYLGKATLSAKEPGITVYDEHCHSRHPHASRICARTAGRGPHQP